MTEYELSDLLATNGLAVVETFSLYVSVMAAYLVATYLAGSKLSTSQIVTISTLYTVAASFFIWVISAYANRAIEYSNELEALRPDMTYGAQPAARNVILVIMILGVLASLKFAWDIRHRERK